MAQWLWCPTNFTGPERRTAPNPAAFAGDWIKAAIFGTLRL
jgi:hypothetical protein